MRALPFPAIALGAAAIVLGCAAARPARYADAPPVSEVVDDAPIPLPRRRDPIAALALAGAYVDRSVVDVLDPRRPPAARDVNALDEVPRSSWFGRPDPADEAAAIAPPEPPLRVLSSAPESDGDGLAIVDAGGRRFELRADPPDLPGLRGTAAAVASRLVAALGYLAAPAWPLDVAWSDLVFSDPAAYDKARALFAAAPQRLQGAAIRWPIGLESGPTPAADVRGDDANDRVPHEDRRTLRALKVVLAWLGVNDRPPSLLRDAYVGAPGRGHLRHYVVDLGGALGADRVVRPRGAVAGFDLGGAAPWQAFLSLGLYTPASPPAERHGLRLDAFDERVSPADFAVAPPFAPIARALPSDEYWAARRLLAVTDADIDAALDAARLADPSARARIAELLRARRRSIASWAFSRVTPCEVAGRDGRGRLLLRDEAVAAGLGGAPASYAAVFVDDSGREVARRAAVARSGATLTLPLPASGAAGYLVVRVSAQGGDGVGRRPFEVHLVPKGGGWAIVAARH